MKKYVAGYDPLTVPSILVPKGGHSIRLPQGLLSRSTGGVSSARQAVARDICELRRVYPDVSAITWIPPPVITSDAPPVGGVARVVSCSKVPQHKGIGNSEQETMWSGGGGINVISAGGM